MRVEFLGTGGAVTTPKPGCQCRVCAEAREKGPPYSRMGPSVFVHGPNALIDTPEEIKLQLDRSTVGRIDACFYSHWHPDHVMGRRVWETNRDWRGWPPRHRCTDIYLPERVAADFKARLGTWEHLVFFERRGLVRLIEVPLGDSVELNGVVVTPVRLSECYAFAFLLQERDKRLFVAPDELLGWDPPREVQGLDLAVVPMGILEFDPFTGERRINENHRVLKTEATFNQTLKIVERLKAARVIMTHIEEPDQLTYAELERLGERFRAEGRCISFAHDTLVVDM